MAVAGAEHAAASDNALSIVRPLSNAVFCPFDRLSACLPVPCPLLKNSAF